MILATISIFTGTDMIKRAEFQTLNTNLLLIQAKVQIIAEKASFENNFATQEEEPKGPLVGTKLTDDEKAQLFSNGIISSNETDDYYYYLEQKHLESMDLGNIKVKDEKTYLVNYNISRLTIIYVPGYQSEYTLENIANIDINQD